VTPDGRTVVFQETGSTTSGIRAMDFDSTQAARTIVPAAFGESNPALSPDGRWLAYQSDQTGQMEVYVQSYPQPGARVPISLQGGSEPAWAHNGRDLFYRSGDSLMVAPVKLSPTFTVTERRRLFTGSFLSGGSFRDYDVAPDDQHYVMISGGSAQPHSLVYRTCFSGCCTSHGRKGSRRSAKVLRERRVWDRRPEHFLSRLGQRPN
jgi:dipeptidyl aminopeptidase/acylaminoacyl peptidase